MTRLVLEKGPRAVSSHQRPLTPAPSRARAAARRLPIWHANECGPLRRVPQDGSPAGGTPGAPVPWAADIYSRSPAPPLQRLPCACAASAGPPLFRSRSEVSAEAEPRTGNGSWTARAWQHLGIGIKIGIGTGSWWSVCEWAGRGWSAELDRALPRGHAVLSCPLSERCIVLRGWLL